MMIKSSMFRVIGILLLISVLFVGCKAVEPTIGTTPTQGPAVTSAPVTISFMGWGSPNEKKVYEMMIAKFKSATQNEVTYIVSSPAEYIVKLQSLAAGKKLPDVFYLPGGFLWQWAASGQIANLQSYVDQSKLFDVKNVWGKAGIDQYRFDGSQVGVGDIYALPKDVGPWSFVYNKKLFEECGVPTPDPDKPWTWDDVIKYGKMMTKDTNGDGKTDTFGFGWFTLETAVWSNGASWLDATKKKITVDTPEFIEALQFVADLTNKYGICPTPEDDKSMNAYTRWLNGNVGVLNGGPWDLNAYRGLAFDFDIMPAPASPKTGKSATWLGTMGLAISSTCKTPQQSFDFASYLAFDPDGQRSMYMEGQIVPNLIDMAKGEFVEWDAKPKNKVEFIQILEDYGRVFEYTTTYNSEWMGPFNVGLAEVMTGKRTAAEFCKEVQPKMQELLDKSYALASSAK